MKDKYKHICNFLDKEIKDCKQYGHSYWFGDDEYEDFWTSEIEDYYGSELYYLHYDYLPDDSEEIKHAQYVDKNGVAWGSFYGYRKIDMNSIYSKEIMRQKKIDYIIGIEVINKPPTFGDIMKNI